MKAKHRNIPENHKMPTILPQSIYHTWHYFQRFKSFQLSVVRHINIPKYFQIWNWNTANYTLRSAFDKVTARPSSTKHVLLWNVYSSRGKYKEINFNTHHTRRLLVPPAKEVQIPVVKVSQSENVNVCMMTTPWQTAGIKWTIPFLVSLVELLSVEYNFTSFFGGWGEESCFRETSKH